MSQIRKTVSEILEDAVFNRPPKPYKNVYFIKVLNPGDRKSIFVSFRYKTTKKEVLLCRVEINLEYPGKNTVVGISLLKPRERESITFFRKRQAVVGRSIIDIVTTIAIPTIVEKIKKVEAEYDPEN